ncbi:hypothetical protein J3R82DRAFT_6493 [Butyriboletus roseoflavus]|nr:hypothetical protein J3R82DRAFT_6493 [Butyriboletus roseoflavus]
MFARKAESLSWFLRGVRQFSSTPRSRRKHVDHYATLSIPRTATKAQIKVCADQRRPMFRTNQLPRRQAIIRFHAVSEAYAILGDDRKRYLLRLRCTFTVALADPLSRREYDRSLGSPFHTLGQHPQATTTRPSQQSGFKHVWPNHPRNRTREPMSGYPNAARHDHLYEHAHARNHMYHRPQSESRESYTGSHKDPFSNPVVQRATGYRRSGPGAASQSSSTQPNFQRDGFQSPRPTPWTASSGEGRRRSAANGHPTPDEAAAESGVMRALGASGLVGVIMLVATMGGNSKRTS